MISPKLIDVEGNRIETEQGYYWKQKSGINATFIDMNNKLKGKYMESKDGRFPTQLFTNINEDKYKYIKII